MTTPDRAAEQRELLIRIIQAGADVVLNNDTFIEMDAQFVPAGYGSSEAAGVWDSWQARCEELMERQHAEALADMLLAVRTGSEPMIGGAK